MVLTLLTTVGVLLMMNIQKRDASRNAEAKASRGGEK
jgi:hypothetical protein